VAPGLAPPPPLGGIPKPAGPSIPKADNPPTGKKPKQKLDPGAKLKQFHWTKIPNPKIEGTLWYALNDESIPLDTEDLKSQFAAKAVRKEDKEKSEKKKIELVKLIDDKRSYNVDLTTARFRVSSEALREAILSMDEKVLDLETLGMVSRCAPTSTEVETVKGYDGDESLLGSTEKFFLALADIPNLAERIDFWLFKQNFDESLRDLRGKLHFIVNATLEIQTSKKFQKLLEIVLAIGNFLNGGTHQGQAYGFKLGALKQLAATKSVDNKGTLLTFIVKFINSNMPEVRGFLDDFKDLPEAVRIESQPFLADVDKLKNTTEKLKKFLDSYTPSSPQDNFVAVMTAFHNSALVKVTSLGNDVAEAVKDTENLAVSFAEPIGKTPWEEFFKVFLEFCDLYRQAEDSVRKEEQVLLKERKRRETEAQRRAVRNQLFFF
jgi:hypothetical protein